MRVRAAEARVVTAEDRQRTLRPIVESTPAPALPKYSARFLGCGDAPVPNWPIVVRILRSSYVDSSIPAWTLTTDANGWVYWDFDGTSGWYPDNLAGDQYWVNPEIAEWVSGFSSYGISYKSLMTPQLVDDVTLTRTFSAASYGQPRSCFKDCLVGLASIKSTASGSSAVQLRGAGSGFGSPPIVWTQAFTVVGKECSGGTLVNTSTGIVQFSLDPSTGDLTLTGTRWLVSGIDYAGGTYTSQTCSGRTSTVESVTKAPSSYACDPWQAVYSFAGTGVGDLYSIGTVTLTRT